MKKVVYVKIENGTKSLEAFAKECKRNGHLVSIVNDPYLQGVRKYYTFNQPAADKRPVEVTEVNNRVISVRRVPEIVLKTLPPIDAPQFGNF